MRDFLERFRLVGAHLVDIWRDRDIHWPAFKSGMRQLPSKFKNADASQRVYIFLLFALVLASQIYFVIM